MSKLNCTASDLRDFKESYAGLYNFQKYYEQLEKGGRIPADIKEMIKRADKVHKLLLKFDWTSTK
jgi:hypothetical protein